MFGISHSISPVVDTLFHLLEISHLQLIFILVKHNKTLTLIKQTKSLSQ